MPVRILPRFVAAGVALAAIPAGADSHLPMDGHLGLALAQQLLIERNPDLRAAQAAVRGAEADRVTAGERPNATFSVNTSNFNLDHGIGAGSPWDKRTDSVFRIDQTFERGGKRRLRLRQSDANLDAAQDDYADALRQQRLALALAYWDLKRATDKLAVARDVAALEHRSLDLVELRLAHGDIARLDVSRLRIETARADTDANAAAAKRADAQIALAALLDLSVQAAQLEAEDAWPLSTPPMDMHAGGTGARPDVAAARARLGAAGSGVDLAKAQRTRDVTIGALYEHFPPDGNNMLGVGISVPLFTGSRFEGEIGRALADRDAAESHLASIELAARADLARARADLAAAGERARRYDTDLLAEAHDADRSAETAYRAGGLSLTDLLDARRNLKAVEDEAADAHADYAEALAALAAAAPNDKDVKTP